MKKILYFIPGVILLTSLTNAQDASRVSQLKDSWLRARERAVAPVDKTYQAELEKLVDFYAKSGKLDAALQVRNELNRVNQLTSATQDAKKTESPDLDIEKALLGDWTWNVKSAGIKFLDDGVLKYYWDLTKNPSPAKWTKQSESTVLGIFLDNGNRYEITLSRTGEKAEVKPLDQAMEPFEISKK